MCSLGPRPSGFGFPPLATPHCAHRLHQIFDHPVSPRSLEGISGRAVLPHGVTNGLEHISPQVGLGQQAGQIPGQHVAAAALGQVRIARRVHINFP